MIARLRLAVGARLFWWGHALMPKPTRTLISMIVSIGHQWAKAEPETFERIIEAIKADRVCRVTLTFSGSKIEIDGQ